VHRCILRLQSAKAVQKVCDIVQTGLGLPLYALPCGILPVREHVLIEKISHDAADLSALVHRPARHGTVVGSTVGENPAGDIGPDLSGSKDLLFLLPGGSVIGYHPV